MKEKVLFIWKNFMYSSIVTISESDETYNYRNKAIAILSYLLSIVEDGKNVIPITSMDISKVLKTTNSSLHRSIVLLEKLGLIERVQEEGFGNRKIFIIPKLNEIFKEEG